MPVKKMLTKKSQGTVIGPLLLVDTYSPDGTKQASGHDGADIAELVEDFSDVLGVWISPRSSS